jgi:hypothetical protein
MKIFKYEIFVTIFKYEIFVKIFKYEIFMNIFKYEISMNIFKYEILIKNFKCEIFMKIRPVVTELFHADGRKDITKLFAILQTPQENLLLCLKPAYLTRCPISSAVLYTVPHDFLINSGPVMNQRVF